jgi:thymidylate kinase
MTAREPSRTRGVEPAHAGVRAALAALERAGVTVRERKPSDHPAEVDVWLDERDAATADEVLERLGFHLLDAPGHPAHRFYVSFREGRWLKLDAKTRPDGRAPFLDRVRPASATRVGPVVAVLGPDGAGKGSVIAALRAEIPVGTTAVYLGRRPRRGASSGTPVPSRRAGAVRESVFVLRNYLRSLRALAPGYAAAWRGHVVLCDRHPLEVLAVLPDRTPLAARLERFLARRLTPWPDAVVVLDAPAPTLFERKGEHSVEVLERWRRGYLEAFGDHARVVSTLGPLEETVAAVSAVIWEALAARRRWPCTATEAPDELRAP